MQDAPGVRRRARSDSSTRNRRDPRWLPTSGEGAAYKRNAKWQRARRESEGPMVPLTPGESRDEGRGPALVMLANEGRLGGMVLGPNTLPSKQPSLGSELFTSAKSPWGRRATHRRTRPSGVTTRVAVGGRHRSGSGRDPGLSTTPNRTQLLELRMQREKTIGKPCAGNPHARFERGPQETERVRHRA